MCKILSICKIIMIFSNTVVESSGPNISNILYCTKLNILQKSLISFSHLENEHAGHENKQLQK